MHVLFKLRESRSGIEVDEIHLVPGGSTGSPPPEPYVIYPNGFIIPVGDVLRLSREGVAFDTGGHIGE